jgi:DNA repair photolyase
MRALPPRHQRPGAEAPPVDLQRGRGATDNPAGRFERHRLEVLDDGWGTIEEAPPPLRTIVTEERTADPFATNDSPDVPFDRSFNPYKGCEHGCIYCFARPTHSYLGLSPGLDFESRIVAKPDAPQRIRERLSRRGYVPEAVAIGGNTDPYQPAEVDRRITRSALEVFRDFGHPVGIVTKSALVTRDLDILAPMAERGLVRVFFSVTTLSPALARSMEPRASAPHRRLQAMAALHAEGVPTGVLASPMIPALNDHELERILAAAREHGARWAGYILLRLPHELKDLLEGWLDAHHPGRKRHVLDRLRELRGGELYQSEFGTRMRGTGPQADLLERRFELAFRRLGYEAETPPWPLHHFAVPKPPDRQGELFGSRG